MIIIICLLAGYSIVSIITESYLFGSIRRFFENISGILGNFLNCQLCVSVWVSFALTFVILPYINVDYILRGLLTFAFTTVIMFIFYFERFLIK
jgi:hypothetical protein